MIFLLLMLTLFVALVMAMVANIELDSDNVLLCIMTIFSYLLLCLLFMLFTLQLKNEIINEKYQENPSLIDKEIEKLKIKKEYFIKEKEFKKKLEDLDNIKDNV